jgi:allophanate hydrolase subunit 1
MFKKLNNIGDSAVVCDFGDEVNQTVNNGVITLFHFIKKQSALGKIEGILNCTPSYNKLIISFDLQITNLNKVFDFINSVDFTNLNLDKDKKEWTIPICYEFGVDLLYLIKEGHFQLNVTLNFPLNHS